MYVYLSLGSNEGCARDHFGYALEALTSRVGVVVGVSRVYRSPAMYVKDQAMFSNLVVCVKTLFSPVKLLRLLWQIEYEAGRVRIVDKGPRTLDIDIVSYGYKRIRLPFLTIPHKGWLERAFVILPLYEVMSRLEPWQAQCMGVTAAVRGLSLSDRLRTRPYYRDRVRQWKLDRWRWRGKRLCCCGLRKGLC